MTMALSGSLARSNRATWIAVAATTGCVALAARRAESPLHFILLAGFSALLVALGAIDATTMRLPNKLTYPGIVVAVLVSGFWPDHTWRASLAGGAAGFAIMLALFVIVPGFGAGDVKLCTLIGLLVGWPHVLGALFAGILIGGLVAAAGLLTRRLKLRSIMPYGPALVAGALLLLLLQRT